MIETLFVKFGKFFDFILEMTGLS